MAVANQATVLALTQSGLSYAEHLHTIGTQLLTSEVAALFKLVRETQPGRLVVRAINEDNNNGPET
jgi:hypothetical protein